MSPLIPHFTNECLSKFEDKKIDWPTVSEEALVEKEINFVIQINGKKRALLKAKRNINEKDILTEIKSRVETEKLLINQNIKKIIFIPNRLINIIL